MTKSYTAPHHWTPGDTISASRLNKFTTNDEYFKERMDGLSPPGVVGPKAFYDFDGIYWELQNFGAVLLSEAVIDFFNFDTGWAEWSSPYVEFGPGAGIDGGVLLSKRVMVSPTCLPSWDVNRHLLVALSTINTWFRDNSTLYGNEIWLVTGKIDDITSDVNIEPHVGFRIDPAGIYASAGDGVDNHQEEIMAAEDIPGQIHYWDVFEVVLKSNKAYYYLNDVLKATISSKIPDGETLANYLFECSLSIRTNAGTSANIGGIRFLLDGVVRRPWEKESI